MVWLALCALHGTASMLVWWMGEPLASVTIWRDQGWMNRPWTWWTSAWVHMNTPHLISNQLAVGALAAMAWVLRPDQWAALAWSLAWPLVALALPWWPQVGYYAGLSGLIHAAVAVVAVDLLTQPDSVPKARRWGGLLAAGLVVKLVFEQGWHWPVVWSEGLGISVVQAAHLVGAVAGAAVMLALVGWRRRR